MTQKPRYGDFGELNPIVFPGKACPGTPPCLGNRSVFILDPRLVPYKGFTGSGSLDPHKQCYVFTKELCGIRLADFAKTELYWISPMTLAKCVL